MLKAKSIIPFFIILSITYFLSGERLLQKFMPRSVCMYQNQKLINLHLVSDAVIFISYIGIGTALLLLYNKVKDRGLPFSDLTWKFGGFIVFCGLTHLIGILNLFITYYWLDGIVKLLTAWFSILVFLSLLKRYKPLRETKTPKEFEEMKKELAEILEKLNKKE